MIRANQELVIDHRWRCVAAAIIETILGDELKLVRRFEDRRSPGQQAYWLLKLNADKIALKFRQSDLSAMDDATKQQLIADIRDSLGVKPFVKAVI